MLTRRGLLTTPLVCLANGGELPLVPLPNRVVRRDGAFRIDGNTAVRTDATCSKEAEALAKSLKVGVSRDRGQIVLAVSREAAVLGPEGYRLQVTPKRVSITAASPAGIYCGTQTLRQLMPGIPCVDIEDSPRFAWRGCLVDPARHFRPKADVLRFIDALALHKVNILQLHLTDDQGWRIEIKKYPRLTEIGSTRKETRVGHENRSTEFDGQPHGGFYAQSDIREIVAYAAARHITVVPEIEMPGHAQAALAAYPEFGNTGERLEVWTRWGVSKNVFGVSDKTFRFLEDVLGEVLDLFPSRYIHVGGDEVPKDQWKASAEAQAKIRELRLKDESGLHTWFIGRINRFLRSRGRTMVAWGDVTEGGITPGAVVMSWRDMKAGIEAARHGEKVVMAPHTSTYFDYYQAGKETEPFAIGGNTTLEKVYGFEPVPPGVEERLVLGTQGHLWSEYIKTAEYMEYMAFPRMCALSEVMWTSRERRDYAGFLRRLGAHLGRLRTMGVNFRPLA